MGLRNFGEEGGFEPPPLGMPENFTAFFSKHLGVLVPLIKQFLAVFTIGLSLVQFWRVFGISGGCSTPPLYATDAEEITGDHQCGI